MYFGWPKIAPALCSENSDILMTNEVCLGNHEKGLAAGLFVDGLTPQWQGDGVKCELFLSHMEHGWLV